EVDAERGEFAPHRAAGLGRLLRPARGIGEAGDRRRGPAHAATLVVDRDEHAGAAGGGANIGDQPRVALKPGLVGKIMAKIALEEDDAGGPQIGEKRWVVLIKNRRGSKADEEMMADGGDGFAEHAASPRSSVRLLKQASR